MRKVHTGRPSFTVVALAVCLSVGGSPRAHAISFQSDSGWTGSWDTTIGYGHGWRVSDPDCRLIAIANGGCGFSPNIDDGNLNYRGKAAYSEAIKGVTEISLNYHERVGVFLRGDGVYDFAVMRGTDRTPLTHQAKGLVGSYTRLLDAFAYWRFTLGTMPSEIRLGRQVVSWGESTFIQGGLNQVNHFDVSALRVPGAELKEALLPDEMAQFNVQLTQNLASQLLYLFDWHGTTPEPTGSYFGTNDAAVTGGSRLFLGFGAISDQGTDFRSLGGPLITDFQAINRLPDRKPPNSGQYGVNFKLYLPNFSHGTQLGLYFLNYTSRLPVVSSVTGSQAGLGNAWGAANAVGGAAQALAAGLPFAAAVATGAAVGQQRAAAQGGNLSAATAATYATIGANTQLAGGSAANQAASIATYEYGKTAGYFSEFPKDIRMIGLSFNTQIQKTGTALQGEVTYRHGVPLQLDDVELVYATLAPFESGLARLQGAPVTPPGVCVPPPSPTPITGCVQFSNPNRQPLTVSQVIQGWERKNTWQAQFTATQVFANVLKASQVVLLFEGAADYIPGLEDKFSGGPTGRGRRYDGPGTNLSGNPALGGYPQFPTKVEPASQFADKFSWGYVIAGRLEYANLIAPWNILPHFTWEHDVTGVSPGPGGNFLAGRHAVTVGVGADLRAKWNLDVAYTQFGGAGQYNLLNDRNFVAASIKYSF